jgi:uncharacterized membrane protein
MKSKPFSISKYVPVLFLVLFLSFFAHLGSLPLFDIDEGAYSEVTREMLANRDFTSTLLNDIPFFHKPPLFFWIQAVSVKILGLNEFGLRLPSALASLLCASSIFLFTRRFFDTRSAWYATLFMASSLLVTIIGRAATPEAMINLFVTLTLFNMYKYHHNGNKRHVYWSFMFAALGILTKGSVALLIPGAVSFIFLSFKRKFSVLIDMALNPTGLLVFGFIVIPWYVAEFMLYGEAFLSDLFLIGYKQGVTLNFIGGSTPYYLYPALLLLGLLPNTGFFIKALTQIRKLLKDDIVQFMSIWFLVIMLFLPLTVPKSPFTMIYGLPPLCIIMSRVTEDISHSFNIFIWPLIITAFFCLAPDLTPHIMGFINSEYARTALSEGLVYVDAYYQLTLGAILLLLTTLPFLKDAPLATRYSIVGILFVGMIHFLVLPIMGNTIQEPVKTAALLAKKEGLSVVAKKNNSPSFNLYAEMLTSHYPPKQHDIIFTKKSDIGSNLQYESLYEKHGIILARILVVQTEGSATSQE